MLPGFDVILQAENDALNLPKWILKSIFFLAWHYLFAVQVFYKHIKQPIKKVPLP